ncbi:MAG: formate dehydrogenase accessory protein FdhE [Coriobacteriia bacterium]|nr:formate dehydrogenase accessory protein FdhE [Coriobacteriia bacterium]
MTDSARAKAVEKYRAERPDLEHQLALFEKLWEAQSRFSELASGYTLDSSVDEVQKVLKQHRTLFSLAAPEIPLEPYREAVRAIAALMAEESGLPDDQVTALREADLGAAVSEDALGKALSGYDVFVQLVAGSVADERITEPLLSFVLAEAITPFLIGPAKRAVEAAGKFDWLMWDSGLCPVCGTPASSGIVRDEGELQGGRRWLSCPLCRTQWEYARVRCARCGTRRQEDLEYLYDEKDPGHRVHTCKSCHGYTPVSVEKELTVRAVPELEEIVLVPLECVAAERGFTPLGDEAEEVPN